MANAIPSKQHQRTIDITGNRLYYDRKSNTVSSSRGGSSFRNKSEADVMCDLEAALRLQERLSGAIADMRDMLKEA